MGVQVQVPGQAGPAAGRGVWVASQAQVTQGYSHGAGGRGGCSWECLLSHFLPAHPGARFTTQIVHSCGQRRQLCFFCTCLLVTTETWVFKASPWQVRVTTMRKSRPGELGVSLARWGKRWPDVT